MEELEKCLQSKPITKAYALSLLKKERSASPDVTRSLLGMLFRGESFKADKPKRKPKPKPKETCGHCGGDGKLTDDAEPKTELEIVNEIAADRRDNPGSKGRTEIALESGAIKFVPCMSCGGEGQV